MSNANNTNNTNGNNGMKVDVLKYVNTLFLALVAFFLMQMYSKFDEGLTSLIAIDKVVTLHGLKIEHTDQTLEREIARIERELAILKQKPSR